MLEQVAGLEESVTVGEALALERRQALKAQTMQCRVMVVSHLGGLFDQRDIIQVAVLADELDRPILGVVLEERGHDQRVGVLHEVAQTGHIQVAILAAPGEEALTVGNIPCVVNGSEVTAEVDRLNAHGRLLSLCEAVLDVAGHCLIFRRHGQIAGDGLGQVSVPRCRLLLRRLREEHRLFQV